MKKSKCGVGDGGLRNLVVGGWWLGVGGWRLVIGHLKFLIVNFEF